MLAASGNKLSVKFETKKLFVGEKSTVTASGRKDTVFTFTSRKTSVLSIGKKSGIMKAKKAGKAVVTVTASWKENGKKYKAVKKYKIKVKKLKLKENALTLNTGDTASPSFSTGIGSRSVSLSSSNTDFVRVSGRKLTAVYPGTAKITVRVGTAVRLSMQVTVKAESLSDSYEKLLVNKSGIHASENLADLVKSEFGSAKLYYTMSDPTKGTVKNGVYHTSASGTNTIAVTGGGKIKHVIITSYVWTAHRGYLDMYPENTIDAFTGAGEAGAAMCETDVQVTADGTLVCLHNATVTHMTDGTGYVSQKTYDEIRALKIDNGNGLASAKNRYIPTVEEYLRICRQYRMVAVIELKNWKKLSEEEANAAMEKLYRLITKYGMQSRCILISFHADQLKRFYDVNGDTGIPFGALNSTCLKKGQAYNLPELSSNTKTKFGYYTTRDYSPLIGRKNLSYSQY